MSVHIENIHVRIRRPGAAALAVLSFACLASPLRGQERMPDPGGGTPAPRVADALSRRGDVRGDSVFRPSENADRASLLERELSEYIAMPETLMYRMRAGDKGFLVVDLRAPERFGVGRLRGAVNYPWNGGVFLSAAERLPNDRDIFLVSEDGGWGLEALRILLSAGFTRVYSIEGGMRNWPYIDLVEGP